LWLFREFNIKCVTLVFRHLKRSLNAQTYDTGLVRQVGVSARLNDPINYTKLHSSETAKEFLMRKFLRYHELFAVITRKKGQRTSKREMLSHTCWSGVFFLCLTRLT